MVDLHIESAIVNSKISAVFIVSAVEVSLYINYEGGVA